MSAAFLRISMIFKGNGLPADRRCKLLVGPVCTHHRAGLGLALVGGYRLNGSGDRGRGVAGQVVFIGYRAAYAEGGVRSALAVDGVDRSSCEACH